MLNRQIAFLTDYGTSDGFVAMCHGVMGGIAPHHRVLDITHDVPAFDVRHGAVILAQTVPYLPASVVVAVVDPGVGSARRRIAVTTPQHVLVGPDNGLLIWAADAAGGARQAYELSDQAFWIDSDAVTFEGRDVFAPVAAHIANGIDPARVGPELSVDDLVRLPEPRRDVHEGTIATEVLIVDHFGNLALAARRADLVGAGLNEAGQLTIDLGGRRLVVALGRTFADVDVEEPFAYIDAADHVALAVNHGSASANLGLVAGDPVTLSMPAAGSGVVDGGVDAIA